MLQEIARDDLHAALDELVEQLLESAGIRRPPVDALSLAAACGLRIARDNAQVGRARHVRLARSVGRDRAGTILLKAELRPERRQWAIAHEVGEACCQRLFDRLRLDASWDAPGSREAFANQLANRLLLPSDWFAHDARDLDWDLPRLKVRYRTASHELIARRMLDFDVPIVISIFDQAQLTFRKQNCGEAAPALLALERDLQRAAHQQNRPQQATAGRLSVQAWPIHEPCWQREILRTTIAELYE